MLYGLTDEQVKTLCRSRLDGMEHWLRRYIVQTLAPNGERLFELTDEKANLLIKTEIGKKAIDRMGKEPSRYPREVDALLLEDCISIVCNERLYPRFEPGLREAFPEGHMEARTLMMRLIEPRNRLAHVNHISAHQAERVLCYTTDVTESLRNHYRRIGMDQEFNVPTIIRIKDSTGAVYERSMLGGSRLDGKLVLSKHNDPAYSFRSGDEFSIEAEIDPAFPSESYTVTWILEPFTTEHSRQGAGAHYVFANSNVRTVAHLHCRVISNKDWHRLESGVDDLLLMSIRILPPLSEC